MNLLGIHALVWAGDVTPASVEKIIRQSSQAGFGLVEFSLHEPGPLDVPGTRALLREHKMQVACSRGLAFDADVSSDDPAVVARGKALLVQAVELTHALGGSYFGGVLYAPRQVPRAAHRLGRANVIETLQRTGRPAKAKGRHPRAGGGQPLRDQRAQHRRQALRPARRVGAPNVVVHLDTYHMNIEEATRPAGARPAATAWATSTSARATAAISAPARSTSSGFFKALARSATRARSPSSASPPPWWPGAVQQPGGLAQPLGQRHGPGVPCQQLRQGPGPGRGAGRHWPSILDPGRLLSDPA